MDSKPISCHQHDSLYRSWWSIYLLVIHGRRNSNHAQLISFSSCNFQHGGEYINGWTSLKWEIRADWVSSCLHPIVVKLEPHEDLIFQRMSHGFPPWMRIRWKIKSEWLHIGMSPKMKMYGDNDIGTLTTVPLMTWNGLWLKVCWSCWGKKRGSF